MILCVKWCCTQNALSHDPRTFCSKFSPTEVSGSTLLCVLDVTKCSLTAHTLTHTHSLSLSQKLLDWKMAEFKVLFQAVWSRDGTFEILGNETGTSDVTEELTKEQSLS